MDGGTLFTNMCFTFDREKCYGLYFYHSDFKEVSREQGG